MYLVLFEGKYAERMAKQALNKQHILISISTYLNETGFPTEKSFVPSSLIEIYQFDDLVKLFERRYEDRMLVFCAGTNAISQGRVVFLIGCHLIMSKAFSAHEVYRSFEGMECIASNHSRKEARIMDCWLALHQAKSLAWLDFSVQFGQYPDESRTINMEELMHYSRQIHDRISWNPTQSAHNPSFLCTAQHPVPDITSCVHNILFGIQHNDRVLIRRAAAPSTATLSPSSPATSSSSRAPTTSSSPPPAAATTPTFRVLREAEAVTVAVIRR